MLLLNNAHGKEEGSNSSRKTSHPSSSLSQYEHIVRLSTPKSRSRSSQEMGPPHTVWCEYSCPIWHIDSRVKAAETTPRLHQLANPKQDHSSFRNNRENVETYISHAAKVAHTTSRLDQLSLPRLKVSKMFFERGRPEEPIWMVSKGAKNATASSHLQNLSVAKELSKGYISPRDPVWTRGSTLVTL